MLTSWWVLADICNVLELRTDNVKPRLNSEDVNTVVLNHSNTRGNPNKVIINESRLHDPKDVSSTYTPTKVQNTRGQMRDPKDVDSIYTPTAGGRQAVNESDDCMRMP